MTHCLQKQWELLVLIEKGEKDPAVVGRAVDICERIGRVEAVGLRGRSGTSQCRLEVAPSRPGAFRDQRGCHPRTQARAFAPIQRGHDAAIQADCRGVIACTRHIRHGCSVAGPSLVHQPAARPVRRGIESGLVRIGANLAKSGDVGVDQPGIQER